eukprot:TRINITY_DN565_c1_g2_i11.p3 TRINITY_DN565_c1_g2~~TRINITY_DN565_c1_g2_i11.p3  ORF type:complete len:143 (+),score=1.10 TRINITY_DN565_c1_g2_i11:429-857(+)
MYTFIMYLQILHAIIIDSFCRAGYKGIFFLVKHFEQIFEITIKSFQIMLRLFFFKQVLFNKVKFQDFQVCYFWESQISNFFYLRLYNQKDFDRFKIYFFELVRQNLILLVTNFKLIKQVRLNTKIFFSGFGNCLQNLTRYLV